MRSRHLNSFGRIFASMVILSGLFAMDFSRTNAAGSTPISFLVNLQSASHTYFIDGQLGSDSNPGSVTRPWKTIQRAANIILPGDTTIVKAGYYPKRVIVKRSGKVGAQITFQAQGKVVMPGFTVRANYVTLSGFQITDTPNDSVDGWGIFVQGSNCIIQNNYIYYDTRGGILLYAQPGLESSTANCIVRNNRLYRNAMAGIDVRGRNHIVVRNEIWGTIQYHPKWTNPPTWVDADGIRFHGSGHIFRSNFIHDILYSATENRDPHIDCFQTFRSLPSEEAATHILFERNRCINIQAQTPREVGHGFMLQDARDITIRNNIIQAYTGIGGIRSTILTIVNNTFTSNPNLNTSYSPFGIILENVPISTIKNNIFFNLPAHIIYIGDVTSRAGLTSGNNLAYRSDGKPLWTTNTYSHVKDLWGINPRLVSQTNYHLLAGSPAIDRGCVVPVSNDFDGFVRPQGAGYDIGAFEAQ